MQDYLTTGILHAAGFETFGNRGMPRGSQRLGISDLTGRPEFGFDVGPGVHGPAKAFGKASVGHMGAQVAMGFGVTGLGALSALAGDGPGAALDVIVGDIAVASAVHKFHYADAASRMGTSTMVKPGIAHEVMHRAYDKALNQWWGGKPATPYPYAHISTGVRALNTIAYGARVVGAGLGGFAGHTVGSKLGGLVAGDVGSFGGGIVGTFAGSYLTLAAASALATPHGAVIGAVATGAAAVGGTALAAGAAASYGTYQVLRAGYRHRQMQRGIQTSGNLAAFHTQAGQNMRERAVQAIHKSHLNARSALGQEANFLSSPSRNYHSRYR